MPRLLWLLGLVVAFAGGLAAASVLRHGQSDGSQAQRLNDMVSDLEHEVATLQRQLRARDARVVASPSRPASVDGMQPVHARPRTGFPGDALPDAPPQLVDRPRTAAVPQDRSLTAPVSTPSPREEHSSGDRGTGGPPPTAPTVELALQHFYRYLDETGAQGEAGRWAEMRDLARDLRAMGDVGAEALMRVLQHATGADERRAAAALLGTLQHPRALPLLQHVVETEPDLLLRRTAAQALRRLEVPEAIPVLEALLARPTEDRFVRMSAAHGLARLGQPHGITGLTQIFEESTADGRGREMAFRVLASLKDERPLPFMRDVAGSSLEVTYRLQAIRFLAEQGDRQALAALQRVMTSPTEQPSIREAAARAFTAIRSR